MPVQDYSVDVYGQHLSSSAYSVIVDRAKSADVEILRKFAGDEYPGLRGERGIGDLESYWTALFDRDLEGVVRDVVTGKRAFYSTEAEPRVQLVLNDLKIYSADFLIYGELQEPGFITRARELIPYFSQIFYSPSNEPGLETAKSIARISLFNDLFEMQSPAQKIFIDTPEHGIVTLEQQTISIRPPISRYYIGFNVNLLHPTSDAPSFSYALDENGNSEGYTLRGANGFIPRLSKGLKIPTASELVKAILAATAYEYAGVGSAAPERPNNKYLA